MALIRSLSDALCFYIFSMSKCFTAIVECNSVLYKKLPINSEDLLLSNSYPTAMSSRISNTFDQRPSFPRCPQSVTDICAQFVSLPWANCTCVTVGLAETPSELCWSLTLICLATQFVLLPPCTANTDGLEWFMKAFPAYSCSHFYVFIGKFTIKPTVLLFFLGICFQHPGSDA